MTVQMSDPCFASDIDPALYRNFVWESQVHLQINIVSEDFYHQKK